MIRVALGGLIAAAFMTSAAVAADLIVEEDVAEVAMAAAHDWNGAYVGVFAGFASGTAEWEDFPIDFPVDGWLAGVAAGANFQMDSFVLGVEGDVAWSGVAGSEPCPDPTFTCSTDVNWLATLRGRAGFAADTLLIYATAGLAVAEVESDSAPFTPGTTFAATHVGWAAGAGVELAVNESVSLKAEYLYVDLGTQNDADNVLSGLVNTDVGVTLHTVKAGVNFAF